ncbi:macrophage migration inhibitory factor homolog [Lycorma delicatula]|uniref:macrophage migration inhibitory factor homolog n=1 Tax=Lycorma delicatula TaxID=130591 RepID=UPI003F510B4D
MPFFRIETNLPKSKVPATFHQTTVKVIAKALGKPESYCGILIVPDQSISFSGSSDLCGNASLMSIGQLGVEQNKKIAAIIYDHIEKELGIPKDRMYISFIDSPSSDVGYNGTTFHAIFGGK